VGARGGRPGGSGLSLSAGERLGRYEIVAPLGAGGMGEVYRARDARLGREVAVKVLPESLARDPAARERFEREAQSVAALSHPNVVALYDVGFEGERAFAVSELLEGETLAEVLHRGAPPPRKAIEWAGQLARGLAAAHERGLVHRDLKPSNVFITRSGRVKILDFGLAKPVPGLTGAGDATEMPTAVATEPGAILGTVGYMAPEQVRGEPTDARSDLFAFGCVLYEMLAGRRAFARETGAETMTAILREDPPELVGSATAQVPPALARVVVRCLEKNPAERFQSARDLAFAVENASLSSASGQQASLDAVPPTAARRPGVPVWVWAAALAAAAGLAWLAASRGGEVAAPPPPRFVQLTFSGSDYEPAASPDGRLVAFTSSRDGISRIWLKQVGGGGEQPLTEGPDTRARFSPDGGSLLFIHSAERRSSAWRVPVVGGQPRKILDDVLEADWSPDGRRIAFVRRSIMADAAEGLGTAVGVADADGGGERVLLRGEGFLYQGARWSPDGRSVAVVRGVQQGAGRQSSVWIIDVESGEAQERVPLRDTGRFGTPSWRSEGGDFAITRSENALGDVTGKPAEVLLHDPHTDGSRTLFWHNDLSPFRGSINTSAGAVDWLGADRLVFDTFRMEEVLTEVGAGGAGTLTGGLATDRQPDYSPDGRQVAFSSNRSGNLDLWVADTSSGRLRQLTDDPAQDWDPGFTPDGRAVLFSSDRSGNLEIWIASADGTDPRQVTHDGVGAENPTMTRDGEWIVYSSGNPEHVGLWRVRPDGSDATPIAASNLVNPEVSPDGRWVASASIDGASLTSSVRVTEVLTGRDSGFAVDLSFTTRSPNVTYGRSRWMPDGTALAFVGLDERGRTGIYVQDFRPGEDTSATRRPLAGFFDGRHVESFDVAPDGERVTLAVSTERRQLIVAEGVAVDGGGR